MPFPCAYSVVGSGSGSFEGSRNGITNSISNRSSSRSSSGHSTGCPKKKFFSVVLITTGKPNELQKMYNYLEKAEVISFLQIVVYFL